MQFWIDPKSIVTIRETHGLQRELAWNAGTAAPLTWNIVTLKQVGQQFGLHTSPFALSRRPPPTGSSAFTSWSISITSGSPSLRILTQKESPGRHGSPLDLRAKDRLRSLFSTGVAS
jgi:hypothetical protein